MKRTVSLLLCLLLLCPFLFSCSTKLVGDGAIFEAYVASETFCFDPAFASTDDNTAQYLSLIYEGLTKIDANGKLVYALLDHYKSSRDIIRGEYKLTLYLKQTKWSDAASVTADDFLFAWKRLLSSDFSSPAASLLYDIKNAKDAKEGNCSIDAVGIASVDTYTLEVTFPYEINVEAFLRTCASIQLSPLRENVISRNPDTWASRYSTLSVNGPFSVKAMDYKAHTVTLQRNNYYYRNTDEELNKNVEPYKIVINFAKTSDTSAGKDMTSEDLQAQLDRFNSGEILYIGDLPVSVRSEYLAKGTLSDTLSTMSVMVHCKSEILSDKEVRQALSLAVDRQALASAIVFADPATGLLNSLVNDKNAKTSFRKVGGDLLSYSADTAKSKIASAGASGKTLTLTYKLTDEFSAVAGFLKEAWEQLGIKVELKPVMAESHDVKKDDVEYTYYTDTLEQAYLAGDYDLLLCDFGMISTEPFGVLAQFALGYTGNSCDAEKDWEVTPHVCGYQSESYDQLIASIHAETDYAKRVEMLHDAEKALLDDMPIIPLLFNKNFYMISSELKNEKVNYFGFTRLEKVYYKNYTEETDE